MTDAPTKFVLVSGGVISGIGKGLTASAIGVLLKSCGWRVTAIKIDPYLNSDAGTMSPFEHGEVFVLNDGGEVDLDLGNYERFFDVTLSRENNITTGKVYRQVIERERRGEYLGKTVQVVPHVTDAVQDWIREVAVKPDSRTGEVPEVCVIELGGTVGDIESMPFIEALRQLKYDVGVENFASVFVSLVPELGVVGEQKTKPTQHGVKNLASMGLSPDLIVCRSERPLLEETKKKLGMFCQVSPEAVVSVHDVSNTYNIPLMLQKQGVCNMLIKTLRLVWRLPVKLERWAKMASTAESQSGELTIAIVGKYTGLSDSYLSIVKALEHAGMAIGKKILVSWVVSDHLEEKSTRESNGKSAPPASSSSSAGESYELAWKQVTEADGVLVPGGFGDRGVEGKISAAKYCRENKKPYLGICLGMQLAAVEVARNVLGLANANSEEFNPNAQHLVAVNMPEISTTHLGGTMRLGLRKTVIRSEDCLSYWLYGSLGIEERHRHRYEINPKMVEAIERDGGLKFVGQDVNQERMEIVEREDHPFFLGTQFHPEFLTRPGRPSPPFVGFVMACSGMPLDRKNVEQTVMSIREQDPWAE